MKHFLRPNGTSHFLSGCAALVAAACLFFAPHPAHSQAHVLTPVFVHSDPSLARSGNPGYLGVEVIDVNAEKEQALKLKDAHGAVITLIDHDAPAGQVGLKVNDVVLAIDGQTVDDAEQFHRILRQIPPGRKISLEISRDGNVQTLAVQLADHKAMEKSIWAKIGADVAGIVPPFHSKSQAPDSGPAMGLVDSGSTAVPASSFHIPFFGSTLDVGALVEPLTLQMAAYLGVKGGLMVKQVTKQSDADAAGLKAFDVILQVGTESMITSSDWARALRANQGKQVSVIILRDKKQQTLSLRIGPRHRGAVQFDDPSVNGAALELAGPASAADPELMRQFAPLQQTAHRTN